MSPMKISDGVTLERLIEHLNHIASDFEFFSEQHSEFSQDATTPEAFYFCGSVIRNLIKDQAPINKTKLGLNVHIL